MADAPRPSLDELLWSAAAARTRAAAQCTSRLRPTSATTTFRACSRPASTTGAGSRPSRSTTSTPRRRGRAPSSSAWLRVRPGSSWRRGSPSTRNIWAGSGSTRRCFPFALRHADDEGLAREDRWAAGAQAPIRSSRRTLPVDTRDEKLGEDELVQLFSARGREAGVYAAADRLRREVCGDSDVHRRHPQRQLHQRLLLPLRLLRVLEGQARRGPARQAPTWCGRGDRPPGRGGVGARRRRDLPRGGIHPAFTGDTYAEICEAVKAAVPRATRARVLRARGVAGGGDARARPRGLSRAPARGRGSRRCPGRQPRSSTTRCGRSSARTRSRRGGGFLGSRHGAPRRPPARRRRSCSATWRGRGRGRAA